jgi:acetyl-CoA carboxylase biotin carboxylase subunit
MIAKLIVHADSRAEAISRMRRALDEYAVEGVQTTIPLLRRVMRNAKYAAGDYSTRFLDAMLAG